MRGPWEMRGGGGAIPTAAGVSVNRVNSSRPHVNPNERSHGSSVTLLPSPPVKSHPLAPQGMVPCGVQAFCRGRGTSHLQDGGIPGKPRFDEKLIRVLL